MYRTETLPTLQRGDLGCDSDFFWLKEAQCQNYLLYLPMNLPVKIFYTLAWTCKENRKFFTRCSPSVKKSPNLLHVKTQNLASMQKSG